MKLLSMEKINEKVTFIALGLFLLLVLILIVVAMNQQNRDREGSANLGTDASEATSEANTGALTRPPLQYDENLTRELTGAVLMRGPDGTYLRVDVKDVGIVSVGITPETVIFNGETESTFDAIGPFSRVVMEVISLEDTQPYDFLAKSIRVQGADTIPEEAHLDKGAEMIRLVE